jgi:hypothetical protein
VFVSAETKTLTARLATLYIPPLKPVSTKGHWRWRRLKNCGFWLDRLTESSGEVRRQTSERQDSAEYRGQDGAIAANYDRFSRPTPCPSHPGWEDLITGHRTALPRLPCSDTEKSTQPQCHAARDVCGFGASQPARSCAATLTSAVVGWLPFKNTFPLPLHFLRMNTSLPAKTHHPIGDAGGKMMVSSGG